MSVSGDSDSNYVDGINVVRDFQVSLESFAFSQTNLKTPRKRELQATDATEDSNIRHRNYLSSDAGPEDELDLGPSTSRTNQPPRKKKRGYAPPETYAHLRVLQDILADDLDGTLSR